MSNDKLRAELAKEIDDALGLVELPPIRVDRATHTALQEEAKGRGVVIQVIMRERLGMIDLEKLVPMPEPEFGYLVVNENTGQWMESRSGQPAFDIEQMQAMRADTARAVAKRCVAICKSSYNTSTAENVIAAEFGLD